MLLLLGILGAGLVGFTMVGLADRARGALRRRDEEDGDPTPAYDLPAEGRRREHDAADDASAASADAGPVLPLPGSVKPPSLEVWAARLASLAVAAGLQLAYVLKFVSMESGGNPCAVGYPPAKGPDGNPKEMGIAQFFNPDDLRDFGMTGAGLRAYCVPGDQHEVLFKGKLVRGFSSELSRPLTDGEMDEQARGTIDLVNRCRRSARRQLADVGAGPAWSEAHQDFWALVKLQHGLPELSTQGLPAVRKLLGRPPRDWAEFVASIPKVKLGDKVEAKYRHLFPSILDNATRCASAFQERAVA